MPFSPKDVFWSIHLESLLQTTQERSKSPPSSLLPRAQKENQDSVTVNVIMRSGEHRKSAPCYEKPQRDAFPFWLRPHPPYTPFISYITKSVLPFPPFPFLTLPGGEEASPEEAAPVSPLGTPSACWLIAPCSFLFLALGWSLLSLLSRRDANSGRGCTGPNFNLRHPHNSCCQSHVSMVLTARCTHLCSILVQGAVAASLIETEE